MNLTTPLFEIKLIWPAIRVPFGCGFLFWRHFFLIIIGLIQLVLACLRRYGLRVEYRKLAKYLKYCELNLIRSYLPYENGRMSDTKKESEKMLELSTMVNEDLKLYINDAEIAKAKSVMVGEKLGAQIKEISSTEDRLKDLTDLE